MQKENRIQGLGYVRAIACIAIIFIHAIYSAIVLFGEGLSQGETVLYRSILNNLMWAVPCFFMVTGILLLNPEKEITYKKLFSKYIARALGAIVVFGLIFMVLEFLFSTEPIGWQDVLTGIYEIFSGDTWSHMWYLSSLVGIYLLLPFFKMVTKNSEEKDIRYLLILGLIFISLLPIIRIWNLESGFTIYITSIYPFWLFLGYYMKQWGMHKSKKVYALLAVAGTLALVALTWCRWNYGVDVLERFFGYSSCIVILQTIGLFACMMNWQLSENSRLAKILNLLDRHSFGIYLIHLMFIRGIYKHLHFNPFTSGGMLGIIGVVLISLILSLILDVVLKKLPVFKKIL